MKAPATKTHVAVSTTDLTRLRLRRRHHPTTNQQGVLTIITEVEHFALDLTLPVTTVAHALIRLLRSQILDARHGRCKQGKNDILPSSYKCFCFLPRTHMFHLVKQKDTTATPQNPKQAARNYHQILEFSLHVGAEPCVSSSTAVQEHFHIFMHHRRPPPAPPSPRI